MDNKIKDCLHAALCGFQTGENSQNISKEVRLSAEHKDFFETLITVFSLKEDFKAKMQRLDEVFALNAQYAPLHEFFFDLLLINFFTFDAERFGEEYLDSPEWEKVENETIDRGTELLNVLLYLKECELEDITPELSDYLKEFLLIEEEEFQDELEIYEDVINNQHLEDADYKEIAQTAKTLKDDSPLKEVFYAMMSFFSEVNPSLEDVQSFGKNAPNPTFDTAAFWALAVYYEDGEFPLSLS